MPTIKPNLPEPVIMTECLCSSSNQQTEIGDAFETPNSPIPRSSTTSPPNSPNQSTGIRDAFKTPTATLEQIAKAMALLSSTANYAT